jgi:outer membrane lipoprotein-sorting protein
LVRLVLASLIAAVGLASTSTGCHRPVPPPENAIEEPAKLRGAVEARLESMRNARFKEVVLDYFGREQRLKVRQLLLVERPDRVRVQTRVPGSNEIVSLLVSNGETFAMHRRRENEYLTGPPTRENINRLLPVDLSASDVVRVMLGGAPWDRFEREPGEPRLEWDGETGRYDYSVRTASGGRLSMQVRPTDYAVVEVVEYGPDEEVVYEYTTDDWKRFKSGALPTWRRFVWPERDLDFSLDAGETEVDVTLPDSLFELEPPPGSEVIRVRGADSPR